MIPELFFAFLLGLIPLGIFCASALTYGPPTYGPIVITILCFFIFQFLLSWGNPNAYRKDWPIMLALITPSLLLMI